MVKRDGPEGFVGLLSIFFPQLLPPDSDQLSKAQAEMEKSINERLDQSFARTLAAMSKARSLSDIAIRNVSATHPPLPSGKAVAHPPDVKKYQKLSREKVEQSLDAAAQSLVQLENDGRLRLRLKTRDITRIRALSDKGKAKEAARIMATRLSSAARELMGKGSRPQGRPSKKTEQKTGYKCAIEIEGALPRFQKGILDKRRLRGNRRQYIRTLEMLQDAKYSLEESEALMVSRTALSASCHWVSVKRGVTIETVRTYYSMFRRFLAKPSQPAKSSH